MPPLLAIFTRAAMRDVDAACRPPFILLRASVLRARRRAAMF